MSLRDTKETNINQFSGFEYVPKFEISEEDYLKRSDNASSWLARTFPKNQSTKTHDIDIDEAEDYPELVIGDRIMVVKSNNLTNDLTKYPIATVSYTANVHFQEPDVCKGLQWTGITYDTPIGKHNGTIDDISYFSCDLKHGAFVRRKTCFPLNISEKIEFP